MSTSDSFHFLNLFSGPIHSSSRLSVQTLLLLLFIDVTRINVEDNRHWGVPATAVRIKRLGVDITRRTATGSKDETVAGEVRWRCRSRWKRRMERDTERIKGERYGGCLPEGSYGTQGGRQRKRWDGRIPEVSQSFFCRRITWRWLI